MANKRRLIRLTQKLIQINSENPPGDEYRIAKFVGNYLRKMGLKTQIHEFKKRRPNVIAVLAGRSKKHSLLLTPHLDTVPAGGSWRFPAFSAKIYKNKIYGRGATDCKGNLACALEAINSLIENKVRLDYNLIFAATADEESGSDLGLIPLLNRGILNPDAAVVLDSDDFDIIITQKGLLHLKIKIQGKKAHGAYPWRGINAIDLAIKIIQALKKRKVNYSKNQYLRPPTMNIGTIKGGDKVNVVADWCEVELDFRFLPGMSGEDLVREIKKITKRHAPKSRIEIEGIQKPYLIGKNHPLVNVLVDAMKKNSVSPQIKGSEGATVITFFQDKGIPAVATGFGSGGCAHASDEYVKIENLYKGALVLEEFLSSYKFKE
jgi:acetylornithine deacetylase/succinyl-diaminopimelate desuccinylase family protein